jgi:Bacterial pre-peptidase C-terminal domain
MNTNEMHVILVKAKSKKSSFNDAQVEQNMVSHFQTLLLLLRHRIVWMPVLAFIILLSVDISNATTLVNGANQTGTILINTTNSYTFSATKGDSINLRLGTTNFDGWLQLFGPSGTLLKSGTDDGTTDASINDYAATNSGTFTVLVSSWFSGGTGTYALNLSQVPEAFIVPTGDGGGSLTNGANATGTITLGRQDMWSFTAAKGDSINLRLGTTNFSGWLQLFGPDGTLLMSGVDDGSTDASINSYAATNSGTFTVLVSSWFSGGTGTYALNLSQVPEAFIVPAGDGGGSLTNGANATGTITLGRQDMWSFTANKGDNINLRLGTTGFDGWLRLFGPNGALLMSGVDDGSTDASINSYAATNSGTFTVLVSSWFSGGAGTYALHLAQFPEPFVVPAGDQGGGLTGGTSYVGAITLGDQDIWEFTACIGDLISLQLNTTNFDGWLELYGSNGALLKTTGGSTVSSIAYTATNCGTFTVLVSSWFSGQSGTYGLAVNGLSEALKVCPPIISGANLTVNGVGGPTNAVFVLYSTTNIATPFGLWTPILTNNFDQFGVFNSTNVYNSTIPHEYFRFVLP